MSRPFSYNDENFTVIGNILFVHFPFSSAAVAETRLIEIPPAICNRLLTFSNIAAAKGKLVIDGTLDIECNY